MANSVYEASVKLTVDSAPVEKGLNGVGEKLKGASNSALSFGDILRANVVSQAIISGVKTLANAFGDIVKQGVRYNAQIEQSRVALTTLMGDEQQAIDLMEQIKKNASVTPFDVASLTSATQMLISAEVSADEATKTIMALGDAVSATGGDANTLTRMAGNLQQVKNVGKATAMDLKQFQMAGINVTKLIAEQTGKTIEQVEEMGVTYDMLSTALQNASVEGGKYFGAMERQSHTFNGMLSTVKDNATSLMGQMTEGISLGLVGTMGQLNDGLVQMKDIYQNEGLSAMLIAGSDTIANIGKGMLENIPTLLNDGLQVLFNLLQHFEGQMPQFTQWAIKLIGQIGLTLLNNAPLLIGHAIGMLGSMLAGISQVLIDVGTNIVGGIWEGIVKMKAQFENDIRNFFGGIVNSVKSFLGIHSPSRVFAEIGKNMALGVGEGWDSEYSHIQKDITKGMNFSRSSNFGINSNGALGGVSVVQNIYSKAMTRSDLMQEALYNQKKGMLLNV